MKLGLGLYRHMLTCDNFKFARQAGATHLVVHLVDYFRSRTDAACDQPTGDEEGWGWAGDPDLLWSVEELRSLRATINDFGLELEAIENFDPAHWHDILLDGPKRRQHIENVQTIIRNVGEAGIPIIGYNFSIAGVCGRIKGPFARGEAISVGMDQACDTPIPNGMVWNMRYERAPPHGHLPQITHDVLWSRLERFLTDVLPVAEASGVTLAAHPDDPPLPTMRGQPRLVYQPQLFQRLLDINESTSNALEFCVGTVAEMTDGDVYEATDRFSRLNRIAYVHLRNVRGKVPRYREAFVDDGDVDVVRVLRVLKKNGFEGVLLPDHSPLMSCDAPWHAGMSHALGYMRGALQAMDSA